MKWCVKAKCTSPCAYGMVVAATCWLQQQEATARKSRLKKSRLAARVAPPHNAYVIANQMMELIVGLDGWCYTFFDIWAMSTRT